jgi:hypothetical protein
MEMTHKLKSALLVFAGVALLAPLSGLAQPPDRDRDRDRDFARRDFPRYLKARSDLREAQFLLRNREDSAVARQLQSADRELGLAIREIEGAASANGRNLENNPPPDNTYDRRGRFSRVMELMRTAKENLQAEEANPDARAWRERAFRHIDLAIGFVRGAAIRLRIERDIGGF